MGTIKLKSSGIDTVYLGLKSVLVYSYNQQSGEFVSPRYCERLKALSYLENVKLQNVP